MAEALRLLFKVSARCGTQLRYDTREMASRGIVSLYAPFSFGSNLFRSLHEPSSVEIGTKFEGEYCASRTLANPTIGVRR